MVTRVSLVFDDGFEKSSSRIAGLFESKGLRATFAVIVDHSDFLPEFPKGDFAMWNDLQKRGHVVHPHGYDHSDLSKLPFEEAKRKIDACLDYFVGHLHHFTVQDAIYFLAYNRSTPEIDDYLLSKVSAIRTTGPDGLVGTGMNRQADLDKRVIDCAWHGPDHCDDHLFATIRKAEVQQPVLMNYMMHGLDDEGWGPVREEALSEALDYIIRSDSLQYTSLNNI